MRSNSLEAAKTLFKGLARLTVIEQMLGLYVVKISYSAQRQGNCYRKKYSKVTGDIF